jgi:hypothetical protein
MKLLKFPEIGINDVHTGLRNLATSIESGNFGDAHNLVWVVDCGEGVVETGLLGKASAPGAEAFLLLAMGQKTIMDGVEA